MTTKNETATVLLMRESEAARAIGVSPKTLRNWRSMTPQRGPKPTRIGRTVFYSTAEIQRWLDEHTAR